LKTKRLIEIQTRKGTKKIYAYVVGNIAINQDPESKLYTLTALPCGYALKNKIQFSSLNEAKYKAAKIDALLLWKFVRGPENLLQAPEIIGYINEILESDYPH
jgi:hypothetical protein